MKQLGFAEAERQTLRARGISVLGDLRRHGVDGLERLGVHGYLLERCARSLASPDGSPALPPELRDPAIHGTPSVPVASVAKETLAPKGDKRFGKTGPRAPETKVCERGHEVQRKRGPTFYAPCPECGGAIVRAPRK